MGFFHRISSDSLEKATTTTATTTSYLTKNVVAVKPLEVNI